MSDEWSNFKQISGSIYLSDMDSYEANSKNFINNHLSQTSQFIKSAFLADSPAAAVNANDEFSKPKILHNDEACLKTFELSLMKKSNDLFNMNALVFFIESNGKSITNKVFCKMSIWLDMNKFNQSNGLSVNFDLQLDDYGLKNESTNTDSFHS